MMSGQINYPISLINRKVNQMTEEVRVDSCYAITIKYLSPTNTKGTRIKLIPNDDLKLGLDFKSVTLTKDYSTDSFKQALNYVVKVMSMPLPKYNLSTTDTDILIFDKTEVNNIFYFNKESVG